MSLPKRLLAYVAALAVALSPAFESAAQAGPGGRGGGSSGGGGGRSGFSGGSSGRSSFSGGSSGRSSFSGGSSSSRPSSGFSGGSSKPTTYSSGGGSKPSLSGFSGGSKPAAGTTGGSATGSRPSGSGFSGGTTNSKGNVVTSRPVEGKAPVSVSKKPATNTNFDKLAGEQAKKAESRANYERSEKPATTYKTASGKEAKIDPKDKEIDYLRGRLDQQKWVNRTQRETAYYAPYASRPMVIYSDHYHPYFHYRLMDMGLDVMTLWVYHHQLSMDAARLQFMYAQNAQLQARVAALEAKTVPGGGAGGGLMSYVGTRNPTYTPDGVEPDLEYNREYVDAAYNPKPKVTEEYEYEPDHSGVGTALLWVFVYIPLTLIATLIVLRVLIWLLFEARW